MSLPLPMGFAPMCSVADAGTPTPFYSATVARSGQVFLVVVQPYKLGATRAPAIRALPMGMAPMCVITNNTGQAGLVTLLYSDTGYTSPGFGNNANVNFDGRVTQPLRMTWSIPVVPEADRRVALEVSGIDLINADGALDALVNSYDIGGRAVTVYFGLDSYAFDQFVPIWSGRAQDWTRDFNQLEITARDAGYLLEIPLQTVRYTGTGGINGTSDLANKPVPICFGKVRNITPQGVDPVNLVYQVHTRVIAGVDGVYDKGVALTATSDYASYAALIAAAPGVGFYATCLAFGLIKLGGTPAGGVTADVRGDAQGGYIATTATIAQRLFTDFAGISTTFLDTQAFSNFDGLVTGTIGWYRDSSQVITAADAVSQIVGHCSGYWGALPDGRFTINRLDAPTEAALTEDFQAYDILDAEIITPPDGTFPPRFRQRVSYQRNWTVQAPTELAGSVTQARALTVSQDNLVTASLNSNTQSDFLLAQDPPILDSLFDLLADAQAEATRLEGLLGVMRQAVRVSLNTAGHRVPRGSCVAVTSPRLNGGSRWLARVIGAEVDAEKREVDLILWG